MDSLPDADGMKVIETSSGAVMTIDAYDDGTFRLIGDDGGATSRRPASALIQRLKTGEYYTRNSDVHGALQRLDDQYEPEDDEDEP